MKKKVNLPKIQINLENATNNTENRRESPGRSLTPPSSPDPLDSSPRNPKNQEKVQSKISKLRNIGLRKIAEKPDPKAALISSVSPQKKKQNFADLTKNILKFQTHIFYFELENPLEEVMSNSYTKNSKTSYISISSQSRDAIFQLKFFSLLNQYPDSKKVRYMLQGTYNFDTFKEISLIKLMKKMHKIEKKMIKKNAGINNKKAKNLEELMTMKIEKEDKAKNVFLVKRLKDKGHKVVDCGLGLNRKGEGSICARKGVFGHLNFFPRLIGLEAFLPQNKEKINTNSDIEGHINRETSSQSSSSRSSSSKSISSASSKGEPLNKNFELALLQKFIKENKYNTDLVFEEARLRQMKTGKSNSTEALKLFMQGARKQFNHDSTSEIIREKLSRIIHLQAEPSFYNDILEYFIDAFYHRGIYSRYNIDEKDLSLLRLYYICLDLYPAFRILVFSRIEKTLRIVQKISKKQDFGVAIVDFLKKEKILEDMDEFNVKNFTDDQVINKDDKVVKVIKERARFKGEEEIVMEEKEKKLSRTKLPFEKELLIYILTEIDFSSQYFIKGLKILEFIVELSNGDFSKRDKKFIKPELEEEIETARKSRKSGGNEESLEEKILKFNLNYNEYKNLGLFVGDLYSEAFLGICRLDLDKRITYYNIAKSSSLGVISVKSIERLASLYYKIFMTTKKNLQKEIPKNLGVKALKRHKEFLAKNLRKIYLKILDYSNYVKDHKSIYPYDFFFKHYLKCYHIASGVEQIEKRALTKIENIIANRKFALAKALDFIKPKYILGIPSSFKLTFEILKFLKYEECQDVAFKMNELSLCYEYAYCIERGIKLKPDLYYSVQIYDTLFNNALILGDRLKSLKILGRLGQILEFRGDFETAKRFYQEAVGYFSTGLMRFKDVKKIELYHLGNTLSFYSKFDLGMDRLAIKAYQLSYKIDPLLDLDYVFHYKTEAKLAQKMSAFSSFNRESSEFDPIEIPEKFDFDQNDDDKVTIQRLTKTLIERILNRIQYKNSIDVEFIGIQIMKLKKNLQSEAEKKMMRSSSKRQSTIIDNREAPEIKLEIEKNKISVPFVEYASQTIMKTVAALGDVRLIPNSEIETSNYQNFEIPFFEDIVIKRCHLKENKQLLRYFELKIETNEQIDNFVKNIHYLKLFNPLFVQFYGIECEKVTEKSQHKMTNNSSKDNQNPKEKKYVRIRIFCDDFDYLASSNNNRDNTFGSSRPAFWEPNSQSIDDLIKIMYQMTNSLASMHIIGKPYRMLIPHHIALTKTGTFKIIIPFFVNYFKNPDMLLNPEYRSLISWDDFLYFSPERLGRFFYGEKIPGEEIYRETIYEEKIPKVISEGFKPQDSSFVSSDVYSLGIFFIQVLSCSNIFKPQFFQGEIKVKEILCPINRKKERKEFLKKIKLKLKKIGEQFKFLEYLILSMVDTDILKRPNIFRVREKLEGVLFNETFRLEGLNRRTIYRDFFNSLRILSTGEFLKKGEKLEQDNSEINMNKESEKILEEPHKTLLLLPNNITFQGQTVKDTIPHGNGVIHRDKTEILECEFKFGTPYQRMKFTTKTGETLKFLTKMGYPNKGEYIRKINKKSYTIKLSNFEEKSFLPSTEKVLRKITGILQHDKEGKEDEVEEENQLMKFKTQNLSPKKLKEKELKKFNTRKSIIDASNIQSKFTEKQKEQNMMRIKEYEKYLNFFKENNDYSMEDIELITKNPRYKQEEKKKLIDEKLSNKFTSFFDPFGNQIKISRTPKQEYMNRYKNQNTNRYLSTEDFLRNSIKFSYSKGVIITFLNFEKLIKTVVYYPEISNSKLFISKINTYAITDTHSVFILNKNILQEPSRSKASKENSEGKDTDLDDFWKKFDVPLSLDQKYENQFQNIAFDDLGGGRKLNQSEPPSRKNSSSEKSEKDSAISPETKKQTSMPITTFSEFLGYITYANYSNCIIIDLLGNYFQGEIINGGISKGCLIKNTGHKVTLESGNDEFFYGEIDDNRYIYKGQITHLSKEGYGKLMSISTNKCLYEGEFYSNLPHGKGVLVNPDSGEIVFKGIFRKGVKVYGTQVKKFRKVVDDEFGEERESLKDMKKKDKIYDGIFVPVKAIPKSSRFKIYEFNTLEDNFIFDGICRSLNKNSNEAPKIHAKMFGEKEIIEGPAQISYPENNGFYLGKFVKGKKHGKGVYINDKGDKLVGVWEHGNVTGKLFWNIEDFESNSEKKPKKIKEKKIKSILKDGPEIKNQSEKTSKNASDIEENQEEEYDPEEIRFKYYNNYHPNSKYSSKKMTKSKPILRTYSIGNFKYNSQGKLIQKGFGIIGFSDTSVYKGEILNDQFNGYGFLSFSDGSYYKGQFEHGLYNGYGALYDDSKHSEIRGFFVEGKPENCCIYECFPRTRQEDNNLRKTDQLFKKLKEGSISYRSNDTSKSALAMNKYNVNDFMPKQKKSQEDDEMAIVKKGKIYKGLYVDGKMECAIFDSESVKYFEEDGQFCINNVQVYSILGTVSYQKIENVFYLHGHIKAFLKNGDVFEGEIFQNRISGVGKILKLRVDEKNLSVENSQIFVENSKDEVEENGKMEFSQLKNQKIISTKHEEIYTGEFKNGNPGGLGTKWYPSKKKYTGQFINGEEEGIGIFQRSYLWKIGNFVKGKVNGIFVKCARKKKIQIGYCKNGIKDGLNVKIVNLGESDIIMEWFDNGELKYVERVPITEWFSREY